MEWCHPQSDLSRYYQYVPQMRRILISFSVFVVWSLVIAGASLPAVAAQEATPAVDLSAYPEFDVTMTDSGYEVKTTQVPAGYILLSVTNTTKDSSGAGVIDPAPGQTLDQMLQEAAKSTNQNEFPPFLYTAVVAGGPGSIPPGQTRQQVIHVPAGEWVVFGEGNQPPTKFTSVENAKSVTTPPTGGVKITESDFLFAGLSDSLPVGNQFWEVTNTGQQPHMLVLGKVPDGTTIDQVLEASSRPDNATPPPGGLTESDFTDVEGGILLQSPGQTIWESVNLQPGTYVALCFVTDPKTGKPHVMEGMATLFHVGGAATPIATPKP